MPAKLKVVFPFILNTVLVILLSLLLNLQFFQQVNSLFLDYLGGRVPTRDEIVIIGIDDTSLQKLGAWPWDRSIIADAVNVINAASPRVVAVDVLFLESRSESGDTALANALQSDNVPYVMAAKIDNGKVYNAIFSSKNITDGLVNFSSDIDGKLRKTDLYALTENDKCSLSLAFQTYKLYRYPTNFEANCNANEIKIAQETYPKNNSFNYSDNRFKTYSIVDVIEGKVAAASLHNKMVLIGSTVVDLKSNLNDVFVDTNGDQISGIQVHANIINSFLQNRLQHEIPFTTSLLIALVATNIVLFLFLINKNQIISAGIFTFFVLFENFFGIMLYDKGVNWPFLHFTVVLVLVYAIGLIYKIIFESKQNKFIQKAFKHYVNPIILKKLLSNQHKLRLTGEKKTISVMFSDIRGFTSLSETLLPEDVFRLLNKYLDGMSNEILSCNGIIDKFNGDAIMAFWNAPISDKNFATNSLRAAMRMLKAQPKINRAISESLRLKNTPTLETGIGIHLGQAVIGNIGNRERFDYTAIGDTVNFASRLEGLTKYYHLPILFSHSVKEALDSMLLSSEGPHVIILIDEVRVKGREKSELIYTCIPTTAKGYKAEVEFKNAYETAFSEYQKGNLLVAKKLFKAIQLHPKLIEMMQSRIATINKKTFNGVFTWQEK